MSHRVMTILSQFVEDMEIYSIDESFLSLKGFENYNLKEYGSTIVRTVTKGTGIPVSMGIAPTKTLAKVASKFAKKYKGYNGVCVIDNEDKRIKALKPVSYTHLIPSSAPSVVPRMASNGLSLYPGSLA